jgi:hypothetical protein
MALRQSSLPKLSVGTWCSKEPMLFIWVSDLSWQEGMKQQERQIVSPLNPSLCKSTSEAKKGKKGRGQKDDKVTSRWFFIHRTSGSGRVAVPDLDWVPSSHYSGWFFFDFGSSSPVWCLLLLLLQLGSSFATHAEAGSFQVWCLPGFLCPPGGFLRCSVTWFCQLFTLAFNLNTTIFSQTVSPSVIP